MRVWQQVGAGSVWGLGLWGHLTGLPKVSASLKVGVASSSFPTPTSPPLRLHSRDLGAMMRDLQDGRSVKVANVSVKSLKDQQ